MKFRLETLQHAFDLTLRGSNCRAWNALSPFVNFRRGEPTHPDSANTFRSDVDFDLDQEVPDDKVPEVAHRLTDRLHQAAEHSTSALVSAILNVLGRWRGGELEIPAGCRPDEPAELQSAIKRAKFMLREDQPVYRSGRRAVKVRQPNAPDFTLIFALGLQDSFMYSLTADQPATVEGTRVTFLPRSEALDRSVYDEVFKDYDTDEKRAKLHPADFTNLALEVARRSPWYVLPHRKEKLLTVVEHERPYLVGPNLAAVGSFSIEAKNVPGVLPFVRVSPSKIQIVQEVPS